MFFFRFNAAAPRSFIKQAIEIGLGALYLVSIFFLQHHQSWGGVENQKFVSGFRRWVTYFFPFFSKSPSSQEFCLVWLCYGLVLFCIRFLVGPSSKNRCPFFLLLFIRHCFHFWKPQNSHCKYVHMVYAINITMYIKVCYSPGTFLYFCLSSQIPGHSVLNWS